MSFISLFETIKVVVPEPRIFEFQHQLLKQLLLCAQILFPKGTASFINGPAIVLNNDPKNIAD